MTRNTNILTRGYKYRIYPTKEQIEFFNINFGCCRYVYNRKLAENIKEYELWLFDPINNPKPNPTHISTLDCLPIWKRNPETLWLQEPLAVSLQQSLHHLRAAFRKFFNNCKSGKTKLGYPKFKKKSSNQSFTVTNVFYKLIGNKLKLNKLGSLIKIKMHRDLPSIPKNATISKTASGKYFVTFNCEIPQKYSKGTGIIGIDLGLKDFITTSSGDKYQHPKPNKKDKEILARLRRRVDKKVKGSNNRRKAIQKLARKYEHFSNRTKDFHQKLALTLVQENQFIGVETLKIDNMMKNHRLARSISIASWNKFIKCLYAKCQEYSVVIQGVPSNFASSQMCSSCHYKPEQRKGLSVRKWVCQKCGVEHDRDINAAINIRDLALTIANR